MENTFYLLNISVAGIKSIKNEVCLNFYKKTVDRNFDPEKYRVKAIYGENGSGKSALITAVKIFRDVILNDNYLSESKTQEFLDEIINKTTHKFRFCCEFICDVEDEKIILRYSMCIGRNEDGLYEIQHENLHVKSGNYANNKYKIVFESRDGELSLLDCADKEYVEKKTANLLSSRSFVNLYFTKYEKENLIDRNFAIYMIECSLLVFSLRVYIEEEDQHNLYFWRRMVKRNGLNHQVSINDFLEHESNLEPFLSINERYVDKKVFDKYKKRVSQLTQFIKIFKPDLVTIDIDAKENGEQYVCDLNMNYGDYVINREFESTGIKKLIRLFDCFAAESVGCIVFIDEMDSNLNDVYLCKLIEYFMYYGKGQLCFTTHNLDPMTVLKENKNSIDFLSSDNHLVSWTSRGNASPDNCYRNGMIEDSPFNIDATDFVGIFGE